jgi:hypothetical protein
MWFSLKKVPNKKLEQLIILLLPCLVEKMNHLHKAKSGEPFFFEYIFGLSLLFFVISSFLDVSAQNNYFQKRIVLYSSRNRTNVVNVIFVSYTT